MLLFTLIKTEETNRSSCALQERSYRFGITGRLASADFLNPSALNPLLDPWKFPIPCLGCVHMPLENKSNLEHSKAAFSAETIDSRNLGSSGESGINLAASMYSLYGQICEKTVKDVLTSNSCEQPRWLSTH